MSRAREGSHASGVKGRSDGILVISASPAASHTHITDERGREGEAYLSRVNGVLGGEGLHWGRVE